MGEEGEAPGEKGDCGFAQLIEDERGEQFSVQIGLGELWLVGAQAIEFEDALEPLEGELDLPAQAVELERLGRRQDVGGEVGDDVDVGGGPQTARIGPAAFALRAVARCSAS